MSSLVDTNVLVYRFDPRFPDKQRIARELLRRGLEDDTVRIAHQAVVEFVQAVTRPLARGSGGLLSQLDAMREAEELLTEFEVLYPSDSVLRLAFRGTATYRLNWFEAHMWAYAEHYGLDELVSEDFSHGQYIGAVRVLNPFVQG